MKRVSDNRFAARLLEAVRNSFSGTLQVHADDGVHGEVVLNEGRIAWATCRGQSDTLGVCLWRMGRLSRDQLELLRRAYTENQGRKKLGVLFEELGLMSPPVLRRCLLLHTRSAVTRLLGDGEGETSALPSAPRADEEHLFTPEEVLPPGLATGALDQVEHTQAHRWRLWTSDNSVLEELAGLGGHLASALVSAAGEVLTGYAAGSEVNLRVLGAFLAGAVEASARVMAGTPLKDIEELMVDCSGGWAAIRWIDARHRFLVVVLVDRTGNPSIVRYALRRAVPQIAVWLERGGLLEASGEPSTVPSGQEDLATNPFATRPSLSTERPAAVVEPRVSAGTDPFAAARTERHSHGDSFSMARAGRGSDPDLQTGPFRRTPKS
jgi:predicted regulator of Ras-like GTPase activity (Roadblock/LC7/MglB family)